MPQLVNYLGRKSLSPAEVYDWQKDFGKTQERHSPSQENKQLKGEWAPVVCVKVAAPEGSLTGSKGRITVTEEWLAGQERSRAAPEETLVVPGLSTTVQEHPELSPAGPDGSHAGQGQSREVPQRPLVVPGRSNSLPEISFTDPELSLVFPEPSHVGPEQSPAAQGQSRTLPEQTLVVPGLSTLVPEISFTDPEQPLIVAELSPGGPERSEIPTDAPVIPFQPTSPPVHESTWITSPLRRNLSLPKSTLAPPLFREATSSQSVPASTLAPQPYPKTTSARPPLSAGSTGTEKSAGSVKSQPHESRASSVLKVDSGVWHHGPYFVFI